MAIKITKGDFITKNYNTKETTLSNYDDSSLFYIL